MGATYIREFKVIIHMDTNKYTRDIEMERRDDETREEFIERVNEKLKELAEVD